MTYMGRQLEIGPIKLTNLSLGGALVELKEVDEQGSSQDGLIDHLALRVADIFSAVELIKNQGVELITPEPKSIGPNEYCFFFRGPSGEKIELINR